MRDTISPIDISTAFGRSHKIMIEKSHETISDFPVARPDRIFKVFAGEDKILLEQSLAEMEQRLGI